MMKANRQYGLTRKCDTVVVGERRVLIQKRKSNDDPVAVIISIKEYFDTVLQYHRVTGHGGGDILLFAVEHKFCIPRPAIEIYVSLCRMCNTNKSQQHRNNVIPVSYTHLDVYKRQIGGSFEKFLQAGCHIRSFWTFGAATEGIICSYDHT